MGVFSALFCFCFSLLLFFTATTSSPITLNQLSRNMYIPLLDQHDSSIVRLGAIGGDLPAANPSPSPPPPPYGARPREDSNPFRPSIAVVVGVLTTMFSITFLLLLYARHCKRVNMSYSDQYSNSTGGVPPYAAARKNSGIDRTVIESLPIFRFSSLMGQKDGLECAVCLNRFEPSEVLRLLPKCKHAFHVECVDTWLDAHSTCPLCRYRVDPEDILLVEDPKILHLPQNQPIPPPQEVKEDVSAEDRGFRRVSGRHSSAGERGTSGFVQIVLQKPGESDRRDPTTTSFRRSLDSLGQKKRSDTVSVGCFDRPRKDGLLLSDDGTNIIDRSRFEHRIVVSGGIGVGPSSSSPRSRSSGAAAGGFHQRWSDVQPSDLLYLRSEMIISDSRRLQSGRRGKGKMEEVSSSNNNSNSNSIDGSRWSGKNVINERSVSEITGLSRFSSRESGNNSTSNNSSSSSNGIIRGRYRYGGYGDIGNSNREMIERQAGVVSRWLAWISSQSHPPPQPSDVRSGRTSSASASASASATAVA